VKLLVRLGYYEAVAHRHQSALGLTMPAYRWRRRVLGPDPDTLARASNLAANLNTLGDRAGASDLHEATHNTLLRMLGGDDPSTLTARTTSPSRCCLGDLRGRL
jgi:hypothetical protein